MSEQEILKQIAKLTADMTAVALVTSEVLAAHCRNTPHPLSELSRIDGHCQNFLKAAMPGSGQNAAQMVQWLQERVSLIFANARGHV